MRRGHITKTNGFVDSFSELIFPEFTNRISRDLESVVAAIKSAGFSLKDQLFNRERVRYLAGCFASQDTQFEHERFVRETMRGFKQLELKQRIVKIAEQLETHLSTDFAVAAKQIVAALPPGLDPSRSDDDFGDFIFAPLGEFVVRNGLESKHLSRSLQTLHAITQRFSMEDAIRAFLNRHPEETLRELDKWSTHSNYHVRRLVSEGTRPKLPWSKRLAIDVSVPLPFLHRLHADPTRYVTRSVSNHLNDIAKSHPDLVIQTLKQWQSLGQQNADELRWMCKHALRTLIKQGNQDALSLLGYRADPKIKVTEFRLHASEVQLGDAVEFSFVLSALRDESLMVDYVIDFKKANGSLSPKVHKLKQLTLCKGQSQTLTQRHRLLADATTYKLYPGTHRITLQINGHAFGTRCFELLLPPSAVGR